MGQACDASPGTMAAVLRLDLDVVADLVDRVPGAAVANNNAPGQVVVAGPPEAVEQVADLASGAGGRVRMLDVEGAFHSAAMAPAVEPVREVLGRVDLHDPVPTFLSGIDGRERTTGADVAAGLVDGILSPVRWVDVQHALVDHDVDLLIECGPGGILAGCAKRTIRDVPCLGVAAPDDLDDVLDHLDRQHSPA
jgi:[acyl-carrier-protein] S-malonyltransferase